MIYSDTTREAARRAADWLQANPDKHITGTAMTDANGKAVNTITDKAKCFCAIGRLAFEAGVRPVTRGGEYTPVDKMLGNDVRTSRLFGRNDRHRPDGIAALREVAEDKEIGYV